MSGAVLPERLAPADPEQPEGCLLDATGRPCGAPSIDLGGLVTVYRCEGPEGHRGRHWIEEADEDGTVRRYQWGRARGRQETP